MEAGLLDARADAPGKSRPLRPWIGLAVMLCGTFMTIMDVFIVNVAIPSIRRDLGTSFAEVEFVIAGYGLAYAVALITGGRLGDIFGRRLMFMVGLVAFVLTSVVCGLAPSSLWLVIGRLAQGLAAAILFPQVFSLIRVAFVEPRHSAIAFSVMGVVLGLACVVGQILGGLLVEADLAGLGWRPVFLINIPIGLIAIAAAPFFIDESRSPARLRLDFFGVVLSALGLSLLLFPLIEGRELGWPAWLLTMLLCSVPVLAAFAVHQHCKSARHMSPLLETSLFHDRGFIVGVLVILVFYSTLNSTYFSLTLLMQIGLGLSPVPAGLVLASNALAFMGASLIAGRLPPHWGRFFLILGAAVAAASSLVGAATVSLAASLSGEALIPALVLWGIGQGFLMTPLLNTILRSVHEHHSGSASGVLSTMQQVGGALGVAVVGILFSSTLDHSRSLGMGEAAAYARAFVAASIYSACGAVVASALLLLLPRKSAARNSGGA
ncbi:DHA2 family efflux MFS transporter permease subunit [Rhizobium rhizogenes]|uniref:DHA2 family efflux MFS transporter permease subunit n=1 Tax=Rhizobium rhizogenes TaxID=359 RepID=UPI00056857D2|nr:DHA2 family efflux MFS transporter permease subunit [Rhizobium rhizogenes]NTI23614.1 DHA2 family efflux MFS transporter permease subunit [Rhizobium rhizogenes]QTG07126.1 DHA2 family efflux MFS transporter permease subunit [Rhizobium rhizogenes]